MTAAGASDEEALSQSKLGVANPGDLAGESEENALAQSKLGATDDGGRKGRAACATRQRPATRIG